jgi:DNA polymerase III delta subunit
MIYLFHGNDRPRLHDEVKKLIGGLLARKPDAAVVRMTAADWSEVQFESSIGTQGLFNAAFIISTDGLLGDAASKAFIAEHVSAIAASANVFVFLDTRVDKVTLGKIEKVAKKVVFMEKEEKTAGRGFNVFSLADAFARRDRVRLFALYHEALRHDIPGEEIAGTLYWQVKTLCLASGAETAAQADLKPYAFTKAKTAARNFTAPELIRFSRAIVSLYHDAHAGKGSMEAGLERLILSAV